jgi:LacI family transcriptional regulator
LSRLIQRNVPRVALGRDTGGVQLDFVTGDDDVILKELIKGLVERGHRRMALLVSEPRFHEVQERIKSFNQMCQLLDLDFHSVLDAKAEYGHDSIARSAEFLRNYLDSLSGKHLPFTALITCSSSGSIPALRAFHDFGFQVPADCSLCCMGCDPNAPYTIPSLTNASPHYAELAASCLQVIDERLQGDKSPLLFERIIYRANWRESAGKAPMPHSPARKKAARQVREKPFALTEPGVSPQPAAPK